MHDKISSNDCFGRHKEIEEGWIVFDRYTKGSHEIWYHHETKRRVTIPNHPGADIPKGTLSAIIKAAGYSIEDFFNI